MPRYDLPAASDGSEQWIELKDRDAITRKELKAIRLAFDTDGGAVARIEAQTERIIAWCLTNWQIRALSGDQVQRPQNGNLAQLLQFADAIPGETWFAIEDAINGEDGTGGYAKDCLRPAENPPQPSTD